VDLSTDRELMLAVRDGAVEKSGILFERHHKLLYNFFLKLTSRPDVSEDLVQEVFYRILKFRESFRGESQFTTWMYQIARNVRVDHYRKNRRQMENLDQVGSISDSNPDPEEITINKDNVALLRQALRKLSPEKREVLVLSRFQHFKYEEIGKILNCKVGTIKARVFRALKELTDIYYELAGEKP
jgi:RNA polymerase sigma factor (sigma-70 family)